MIVVADTTPLRYLVVIERAHLLPALYGRVLIPPAVAEDWLEIRKPSRTLEPEVDLDCGEQQAIALAEEVAADLLLIDDWDARLEAKRRRLRVVGTLRVLADGAQRGLADLEESF